MYAWADILYTLRSDRDNVCKTYVIGSSVWVIDEDPPVKLAGQLTKMWKNEMCEVQFPGVQWKYKCPIWVIFETEKLCDDMFRLLDREMNKA